VAATALPEHGGRTVVVRERSGDELVTAKLPASGTFAIAYRHSYYGAPAREVFSARADGGFRLRAIESPRAAVLDYYALAGDRTRRGHWLRLAPAEQRTYEQLALIATDVGRRTLVVGDRRLPLYAHEARHLTISVEEGA
jgi:Domain of unknown function (DUF1850)